MNIELYRSKKEKLDKIFFYTEKGDFCVLGFDELNSSIFTKSKGNFSSRRSTSIKTILTIDRESSLVCMNFDMCQLNLIPIDSDGQLNEPFSVFIEENLILDMKFLNGCDKKTLAIIFRDKLDKINYKTYLISQNQKEIEEGPFNLQDIDKDSSFLIPMPSKGVLIISTESIIYFDGEITKKLEIKLNRFSSWCPYSLDYKVILLGDFIGHIWALELTFLEDHVEEMKIDYLIETSIPSCLKYLSNDFLFVGSNSANSQLLKIKNLKEPKFELIESYDNLGPILDMEVVNINYEHKNTQKYFDKTIPSQIVACCGSYKDGSIRVIRNGIAINEHAKLDLSGICGIWSLKPIGKSIHEKFIIISYLNETRVLAVSGEELEETTIESFEILEPTLFIQSLEPIDSSKFVLQVTNKSIYVIDFLEKKRISSWNCEEFSKINVFSYHMNYLVIGIGKNIYLFKLDGESGVLNEIGKKSMEFDIACLSISDFEQDLYLAVGLWNDISIRILSLDKLEECQKEYIGGEIIPRSVQFVKFEQIKYLLVGMGDGSIFSYVVNLPVLPDFNQIISHKKKYHLGRQPINLYKFTSNNKVLVFACGNFPTIIFGKNKKISFYSIKMKNINSVCQFDTSCFPGSLALATESELIIGTMDQIKKIQIETFIFGQMVFKICHQIETNTFLIATSKLNINPENGQKVEQNSIKLIDDLTFEILDEYQLESNEKALSLLSIQFNTDLDTTYFIVGTGFISGEIEPTKGRIMVFSVSENRKINFISELVTKSVWCLEKYNGNLLAGIESDLTMFSWKNQQENFQLKFECKNSNHVYVMHIDVYNEKIFVGDLMRGTMLLTYDQTKNEFVILASDLRPLWVTSIAIIDEFNYLASENNLNILTTRFKSDLNKLDLLNPSGYYHIGDLINQFKHGSMVTHIQDSEDKFPTIFYATVNGTIGILASLPQKKFEEMLLIENAINQVIKNIGDLNHSEWRAYFNPSRKIQSKDFIDGDLVERFIDLSIVEQEKISQILGITIDEVLEKIENISQNIH